MSDLAVVPVSHDEKKRRLANVYATILSWPVPEKIPHDADGSPDATDKDTDNNEDLH